MSETLHKGWLYTRSNEKFAPSTLIESVYTRDGTLYDSVIQKDIAAIAAKFANINVDNDDTFYIVDKSNYIIMAVDKDGVTSLNFYTPEGDLNSALAAIIALEDKDDALEASILENNGLIQDLANKIANINTNDMSTFIITDDHGNKIMEVDSNGVNSVDFRALDESGNKVITLLELNNIVSNIKLDFSTQIAALVQKDSEQDAAIEALANKTEHIDNNDTSKFVIVDNEKNIAFQVTEDGYTQGVDFITFNTSSNKKYSLNEIGENVGQLNETTATHTSQINDLNKNFGKLTDDDTFNVFYKDGTFKVIDENSDEILTANSTVASAEDFSTPATSLNDLNSRTAGIEASGENQSFVIADNSGNKIMEVNTTGVISVNFTSNVKDQNGEYYNLNQIGLDIDDSLNRVSDIESTLGLDGEVFNIRMESNGADTTFVVKNDSNETIINATATAITLGKDYSTNITSGNFTTQNYNLNNIGDRTQKVSYTDNITTISEALSVTNTITATNNITAKDFVLGSDSDITLSTVEERLTNNESWTAEIAAALGQANADAAFNIKMSNDNNTFIVTNETNNPIINASATNIAFGNNLLVLDATKNTATFNSAITTTAKDFISSYGLNDVGTRTQKINFADSITTINSAVQTPNNITATDFIISATSTSVNDSIVTLDGNVESLQDILGYNSGLYNIDLSNDSDDTFSILDQYNNKILQVDDQGLTTVNVIVKTGPSTLNLVTNGIWISPDPDGNDIITLG